MNKLQLILLSLLFFALNSSISFASLTREEIMQKEMDCLSHPQPVGSAVNWQDVCYNYPVIQENAKPLNQFHQQVVTEELDSFDNNNTSVRTVPVQEQTNREAELFEDQPNAVVVGAPLEQKTDDGSMAQPEITPSPSMNTKKQKIQQDQAVVAEQVNSFMHPKEITGELGVEYSHIIYREPIASLKERGYMYGIYGVYTYRPQKEHEIFDNSIINMYRIDGKFSLGQVDYSSDSGEIRGIQDYMIELRGVAGYDHYFSPTWRATPFAGIGYRRLNDDSSGKQTDLGAAGYERSANYIYLPVGLEISHQFNNPWRVTGTGEYDWLLWGDQISYLSDADSSLPTLVNPQRRGFGARSSLEFARIGNKYNFLIEPFVRYWHISDSQIKSAVGPTGTVVEGFEPNNTSTEIGFKLGAQF